MSALWLPVAIVLGLAPRRVWSALEPRIPVVTMAPVSALMTLLAGFVIGVRGFFAFGEAMADASNRWMLDRLARPAASGDAAVGLVPYGTSVFTLFLFLFLTPTGLFATYLVVTGLFRTVAAWLDRDEAFGDPILTGLDWLVVTLRTRRRDSSRKAARTNREGPEMPDILKTGQWAGIDADFVLLSSRRKAEWDAGAIVMSNDDWYRLGTPYDLETPSGLRTAYPLTKLEAVEVLRRGIRYELPPLNAIRRTPAEGR